MHLALQTLAKAQYPVLHHCHDLASYPKTQMRGLFYPEMVGDVATMCAGMGWEQDFPTS